MVPSDMLSWADRMTTNDIDDLSRFGVLWYRGGMVVGITL